jgi:hypothetical protein
MKDRRNKSELYLNLNRRINEGRTNNERRNIGLSMKDKRRKNEQ